METQNSDPQDFHSQIKAIIRAAHLTQKDLGKSVGMTPSHISLFLNGKLDLQSRKLIRLLEALGVDIHNILKQRLEELSSPQDSDSDLLRMKVKFDHLPENHRAPLLRIMESLAG